MTIITNTETLQDIFTKGVIQTWYKSNLITKINELRNLLEMPAATEAPAQGFYDNHIVSEMAKTDFSALPYGTLKNATAYCLEILCPYTHSPMYDEPYLSGAVVDITD